MVSISIDGVGRIAWANLLSARCQLGELLFDDRRHLVACDVMLYEMKYLLAISKYPINVVFFLLQE